MLALVACRTAPIQDVIEAQLPTIPDAATAAAVDEAIWRAGRKVGWDVERLRPGEMQATWRFKHHRAVVSITHVGRRFNIRYESSRNLLHRDDLIHSKYNRLVQQLMRQIQEESITPVQSGESPAESRT